MNEPIDWNRFKRSDLDQIISDLESAGMKAIERVRQYESDAPTIIATLDRLNTDALEATYRRCQ